MLIAIVIYWLNWWWTWRKKLTDTPSCRQNQQSDNLKNKLHGCKPWPIENKHCMGVNYGQWKTSFTWVKRHGHVGRVGVLKLYKVKNFGWNSVSLAVLTPDSSFCVQTLTALLFHTSVTIEEWNYKILFLYRCVPHCLSRSNGSIQHKLTKRMKAIVQSNSWNKKEHVTDFIPPDKLW